MLACTVVREGNRCHTVPRNKGFLGPPLSAESAHPWHVHKAWPSATLKTQLLLCSKESEKVLHKQQYIERFVQHHSPPWLIATLHDVAIGSHRAVKRQVEKTEWCTLSYHPVLTSARFARRITSFLEDSRFCSMYVAACGRQPLHVRIAWKNRLPNAQQILKRI
jgi:hypothetical protein